MLAMLLTMVFNCIEICPNFTDFEFLGIHISLSPDAQIRDYSSFWLCLLALALAHSVHLLEMRLCYRICCAPCVFWCLSLFPVHGYNSLLPSFVFWQNIEGNIILVLPVSKSKHSWEFVYRSINLALYYLIKSGFRHPEGGRTTHVMAHAKDLQ